MQMIESRCKICGRPTIAKFNVDGQNQTEIEAVQAAVDKFLPMLTCNPCYDAHADRQNSGQVILDTCISLANSSGKRREELALKSTRILAAAIKTYANAIGRQYRAEAKYDEKAFVALLIDRPEKCSETLAQWRNEVRRQTYANTTP